MREYGNDMKVRIPILEFDASRSAMINPRSGYRGRRCPEHAVLCFCHEVVAEVARRRGTRIVRQLRTEAGDRPVYRCIVAGRPLILVQPGVGAPMAAMALEALIAMGCRKFVACGGAGVLHPDLPPGMLLVARSAIRDEGTSYHYQPPGRIVTAGRAAFRALCEVLRESKHHFRTGLVWTTDAFYRETRRRVHARRKEGCLAVEMEAAALFAVARFRGVELACLLYAADDLSGANWSQREYRNGDEATRKQLFGLAARACLRIEQYPTEL